MKTLSHGTRALLSLLVINLLTGYCLMSSLSKPMLSPDPLWAIIGLLVFIDVIVLGTVVFADQIIGSLIAADMEDYKKGKYWTPFGMRDVPKGTTLEQMIENTKDSMPRY